MVKNGVVRAFLYNVSHSAQRHRRKPLEISENCTCTVRWSTLSCRLQLPDLMNRVYQIFYNYYSIEVTATTEQQSVLGQDHSNANSNACSNANSSSNSNATTQTSNNEHGSTGTGTRDFNHANHATISTAYACCTNPSYSDLSKEHYTTTTSAMGRSRAKSSSTIVTATASPSATIATDATATSFSTTATTTVAQQPRPKIVLSPEA